MDLLKAARALALAGVLIPLSANAQSTSGAIAGTARDATGAVLPGVTVEASSPALIEKVRTAVTDGQGNYKILELRPGRYTVTFTLSGFATYRRGDIGLPTGFTATVNGEMKVGDLQETITVAGASPTVDVQNVSSQNVLSRSVLDSLPMAQTLQSFSSVVVGTFLRRGTQDVGGNRGEVVTSISIHGGHQGDMKMLHDGMIFNREGAGGTRYYQANQVSIQEVVIQTGGTVESETGGVTMNIVPKEGGNTFHLTGLANYTSGRLQNDNLTPELVARGLPVGTPVKYVYDSGAGLGGPLKQDKVWFYSGHRGWGAAQTLGGTNGGFANATHKSWLYTPDLSRPNYRKTAQIDSNVRVTWQLTAKQKLNVAFYSQRGCTCFSNAEGRSPEAARYQHYFPNILAQATWSYPVTSRLLFDAGVGDTDTILDFQRQPGVSNDDIAVTELSTNLNYRSIVGSIPYGRNRLAMRTQRASMSYITGSHAFKVGTNIGEALQKVNNETNQNVNYTFRNGIPQSVTLWAMPYFTQVRTMPNLGIYTSDQWTIKRLTLNLGIRFDYVNGGADAVHREASTYVGAADYPALSGAPDWKDVSPRGGAAFDLFGNGKTALKVSYGKYLEPVGVALPLAISPLSQTVLSATRTWSDANVDYIPQANELGPLSNANFGNQVVTSRYDPDLIQGWGKRAYSWQGSAAVQHELRPGLALNVGYFRTSFGNFTTTDNVAVTPADFSSYCLTLPADSRLPGGGGQQRCGFYDINPDKFGLVNNLVTDEASYGKRTEIYNGIDLTMTARFRKDGLLTGGFNTGRTVTHNCGVLVDSPQANGSYTESNAARPVPFCKVVEGFDAQTQFKLSGVLPLPMELQLSGTYQNVGGIPITATYVATNAQIAPSLGRNLGQCRGAATCTGTVTLDIMEPFSAFEPRLQQVDMRLTRNFRLGRGRIQGQFDVYNVFDGSNVLFMTTRFGPSWLAPSEILGARTFKFGMQIDY